jgi:2-amino-4-hydroxy-6-hydroxymethyldihydropteridine diphosphokinase
VGSNVDPFQNIVRALDLLAGYLCITTASAFYRSQAVGEIAQPDFINGVWAARSELPVRELKFAVLRGVEESLERRRTADKNAARPIDLDILLYGDLVMDEPGITIPDPGLRSYPFVALPLLEIVPDILFPDSGERLSDIFPGRPEDYGLVSLPDFSAELAARLKKSELKSPDNDGGRKKM